MLTQMIPTVGPEQRWHFATFGYVVLRQVFRAEEVSRWGQVIEDVLRRQRGGADFAGLKGERVTPLVEEAADVFLPVLDDARLLAIADGLLGDDCLYTGSNDGNLYVGDTVWHIDGGGWHGPCLLKTTIYCEPVAEGSGCLSVLPGSHHPEFFRACYEGFYETRQLDLRSSAIPGRTPVTSLPGDVIAFDHRLWHSSWGGQAGRRQFAFSWAAYPHKSWDETWLQGYLARINQRQGKRLLSDRLLSSAGPRRQQKIAKLYQMGL